MNDRGKSDRPIVPEKPPNNVGRPEAEAVEGRGLAKGNASQQNALRIQGRVGVPSALERVRRAAIQDRKTRFTALLHHVTIDRLAQAFRALKPDAAAGIDGMTWKEYACNLEGNLKDLHGRLHRGAYRAKPSRRVYIPKADGRQRPLGIASLEDKIVQRAVVEVLNAIYEVDFLGFSYGFRPKRKQHDVLDALAAGITRRKVNWVLDSDIRGFFDAIDHRWLVKFVEHRIGDRRVLRLIQKWLKAGVMEDGKKLACEGGTPQGATVSPLLANIYLHYVFDLWAQQWRTRYARGDVIIVRYADDFIVGFEHREDADRFLEELRQRMAKFSLELHPEKTRLIEFGRNAARNRQAHGLGRPDTFNFLGFTHICGRTRKGGFMLRRHTMAKRLRARLHVVSDELRKRMHDPIPQQGAWLRSVAQGYFAYHAIPTNRRAINSFRYEVSLTWRRTLRRRSQKSHLTWERMNRLVKRWLPPARVLHPWPDSRFLARTQGKSPVR